MAATGVSTKTKTEEIQISISLYESLLVISERMMIAAKREEWESVTTHETKHQETSDRLRDLSQNQLFKARNIEQKADLIKKILAVDNQTQELIKNRMKKLQKGIEEERKITQAYKSST